jgi:hypothetical protein
LCLPEFLFFFGLHHDEGSIYIEQCRIDALEMILKENLVAYRDAGSEFIWTDKKLKTRITYVPTEIRTEKFPNTSLRVLSRRQLNSSSIDHLSRMYYMFILTV